MNCAETEKYLSEYLDNEIAPHLRQQIDEHLAQCESCRHKLAQLQALCSSIASLNEELPEDFNAKLAARLAVAKKAQTPNRPLYKKVWFRVSSLAACLLICLGAVGLLTGPGHDGAYEEANDLAAPQLAESSLNKSLAADDAANNMLSQYGMSEDETSTAAPKQILLLMRRLSVPPSLPQQMRILPPAALIAMALIGSIRYGHGCLAL